MKYYWTAESDDGAYDAQSEKMFTTEKECYDDMRNAALEKMKWNTEYDEDFGDVNESGGEYIGYKVSFNKNKIVHKSYSGEYTYTIHECGELSDIGLKEYNRQFALISNLLSETHMTYDEACKVFRTYAMHGNLYMDFMNLTLKLVMLGTKMVSVSSVVTLNARDGKKISKYDFQFGKEV